ncbi:MAG: TolC family protein, partial [Desulfonatronovibrionaceae bacterium]
EQLLKEQTETSRKYLELTRMRFVNGMNTALDVLQQQENLEGTRSRLPGSASAQRQYTHKLAFLLARPQSSLPQSTRSSLPEPGSPPKTGIPARLLSQRPDIRAAWNRLRESEWELTAAKADLLPRITLTARHEYSAEQFNTLFQNWITSLAAGLTAPLFDGKRRTAEVDRTRAVVEERLHAYQETVLTAINEVEDSLSDERWQRRYISRLETRLESARIALDQAKSQYINGMSDYLPVLTELKSVQDLELELLDARKDLLLYRIALYRALGGTWADKLGEQGLIHSVQD